MYWPQYAGIDASIDISGITRTGWSVPPAISKESGAINLGKRGRTCPLPRPPLSLQPHIQSVHHRPSSCSRRLSVSSSSSSISDRPRTCIPAFGLGGSTLDGIGLCDTDVADSAAWSVGRAVGSVVLSSVGVGGIDVGAMKGPRSNAGVDVGGTAVPFVRRISSTNGVASGRTSDVGLEGDELSLLSGRLITGSALLDLLDASEVECEFRVSSRSESLSLKDPGLGRGRVEVASDQSWDTRFETSPTTEWAGRTDSRAAFRRKRSVSSQRLRV